MVVRSIAAQRTHPSPFAGTLTNAYPKAIDTVTFQGIRIPKSKTDRFYEAKPNKAVIWSVRNLIGALGKFWKRAHIQVVPTDAQRLREYTRPGESVILTFNHPRLIGDGYAAFEIGRQAGIVGVGMGELEVFEAFPPISNHLLQWMGAFSVNRTAKDKKESLKAARKVVSEANHPFVVAPEGRVTWSNGVVGPIENGVARISIDIASTEGKPVKIVPISLYHYWNTDLQKPLTKGIVRLEQQAKKLFQEKGLTEPEKSTGFSLAQRLERLLAMWISLVNHRYGLQENGSDLYTRIHETKMALLPALEQKYGIPLKPGSDSLRSQRVRGAIFTHRRHPQPSSPPPEELLQDLEAADQVIHLNAYPKDYLHIDSPERLYETFLKLDRDWTGRSLDGLDVFKHQRTLVHVGEPIDVNHFLKTLPSTSASLHEQAMLLTKKLEESLQAGVTRLEQAHLQKEAS